MNEEVHLKENQFILNDDICEVNGGVVINVSDMERRQKAIDSQPAEEDSVAETTL